MRGSLKIWMVILTITVLGGGITFFTNSYVSSELEKMAATEYSALGMPGMEAEERRAAAAQGAVPDSSQQAFSGGIVQEQSEAIVRVTGDGMPDGADSGTVGEEERMLMNEAVTVDTDGGDGGLEENRNVTNDQDSGQAAGRNVQEESSMQTADGAVGYRSRQAADSDAQGEPGMQTDTDDMSKKRSEQADADDAGMGGTASEGKALAEAAVSEDLAQEAKAEAGKNYGGEKSGAQAVAPGSAAKATGEQTAVMEAADSLDVQEQLAEYEQWLPELDIQIEAMRNSEADNPTVNSVKTTAQTELRIWEREMDGIYRVICESLDDDELQALKKEQQEWIKQKNSKAEAAAKKNSGGTLESVDYIASAAASTRERAYELLKMYKE